MIATRAGVLAILGASILPGGVLRSQEMRVPSLHDESQPLADVMIIGVFHFHNPNADYAKFEGIDVLAEDRQAEIEAVVDALSAFHPTVVAVERPVSEFSDLNDEFRQYVDGEFDLTANEVHQLGFRLAARADRDQIFPVDYQMGMRLDSVFAYTEEHDPQFRPRFDAYIGEIVELMNRMQRNAPIGTNLRFLNEPDNVVRANEPYAVQATVGADDGYVGARSVASWYDRNLRIFANLAKVASPGARVILIIGAGHTPILRDLVRDHPDMRLVEPNDYLDMTAED